MTQRSGLRGSSNGWRIAGVAAITLAVLLVGYGAVVASTRENPSVSDATFTAAPNVERKSAAFLGDSYTSGSGASTGKGYAWQASQRMCWNRGNFGEGSTGYTNAGPEGSGKRIYFDRVADVVASSPDVVIVQGSTNDYDEAQVYTESTRTFEALKAALPGTPIYVVGPLMPPESVPTLVGAARAALIRSTAEQGLPFIDPLAENWVPTDSDNWADGFHPNDTGHTIIADSLSRDISAIDGASSSCS
ncbi:SGNH/GDSL hydrolase family protein [Rhodococcus ruber]|uniref:SGNH/GDSL hydrolase family protein n=1 Tax=Rhodococcus ruber TaxID=1830 RepID=A0ABT4MBF4_9NOCA|nr:SGNH/GDSL hydrolase family protein [Rhodococcus ruber]MCZ4518044.1 SGNH/GDSL hydrolase family protein [Rhodococcus ruber]